MGATGRGAGRSVTACQWNFPPVWLLAEDGPSGALGVGVPGSVVAAWVVGDGATELDLVRLEAP